MDPTLEDNGLTLEHEVKIIINSTNALQNYHETTVDTLTSQPLSVQPSAIKAASEFKNHHRYSSHSQEIDQGANKENERPVEANNNVVMMASQPGD